MSHVQPNLPKACLFDFDGVVVDSAATHMSAWRKAFKQLFSTELPEISSQKYTGKSPAKISSIFCGTIGKDHEADKLFLLKDKILAKSNCAPTLLPGFTELTTFCISKNIPFGIASNATRSFIDKTLKEFSIESIVFLGFEDYSKPKPNPEPYELLAAHLKIERNHFKDCWVFEDSATGIHAAKQAGMTPVGITTQHNGSKLRKEGAEHVFPSLLEAKDFLKEFNY